MKKTFILFALLLTVVSFGQTKIDELLSVTFDGEAIRKDTLISDIPVLAYYLLNGNDMYSVERIFIDSSKDEINNLPSDPESLKKFYKGVEKGYLKTSRQQGYHFKSSSEFNIDEFKGHQVSATLENVKAIESRFLVLNEYIYTLTYLNNTDFSEEKKNTFFNSILINQSRQPKQMLGQPQSQKWAYLLGQLSVYGLVTGVALYFIFRKKRK